MSTLDWQRAVADIGDAVAQLRGHARSNGKVGVVGFCLGGALTFAAARVPEGEAGVRPGDAFNPSRR